MDELLYCGEPSGVLGYDPVGMQQGGGPNAELDGRGNVADAWRDDIFNVCEYNPMHVKDLYAGGQSAGGIRRAWCEDGLKRS